MKDKGSQLAWDDLKRIEGDIPWAVLSKFAAAVVTDSSTVNDLFALYEQAWESSNDHERYEHYYVPAIFALAAAQLSEEKRREIGVFLVAKLDEACCADADVSIEVLMAACGSMGSSVLPAVLDAIEKDRDTQRGWYHLWGLTELADKTEDVELRGRVIGACMGLLGRADRGEIDLDDAIEAAWTLAALKHAECRGLLGRLKKKSADWFCHGDYVDALNLFEDRLDYTPPARLWERSVKGWFEPRWLMLKEWYRDKGDEGDEDEAEAGIEHGYKVVGLFFKSFVADDLSSELFEDSSFILSRVVEYAWNYLGATPEEFDERVLSEVLLEILPRKVTVGRDFYEKVAPVTEAFLRWAEIEGVLEDTEDLVKTVHGWSEAIVANGMNPEYWGPGKSFAMRAQADGVDMGNQEAMDAYIAEYNRGLGQTSLPGEHGHGDLAPTIPIVEHAPKVGRNVPCPCGSGKKYKKCCGSVQNTNVDVG